jgi:hypothetical protein
MGLCGLRVRLKRLSRDWLALERSFPGEQPPPGCARWRRRCFDCSRPPGNQAVTGFVQRLVEQAQDESVWAEGVLSQPEEVGAAPSLVNDEGFASEAASDRRVRDHWAQRGAVGCGELRR